jgi:glycosyltransferase involved in cell wall biosynthesis
LALRAARLAAQGQADVLHGQHLVSGVAASLAAHRARRHGVAVVSVVTVRDYWPLCPASTRLFTDRHGQSFECRDCHRLLSYLACARLNTPWCKAPLMAPALLRWRRTRRAARALCRCDAVVAVSSYVHGELERSGRVPPGKLHTIPNLVDLAEVRRALQGPWPLPDIAPDEPFLLFVGKLETNKGVHMLPTAVARAGVDLPVVVAGEGGLETDLKRAARRRGLDLRFYSWLGNDAVLLLMRHARALLFPSAWQEPLSRVLVEGCAAGAAIVAMNTGGTGDLIAHMHTGWLAQDLDSFVEGIRQVSLDPELNTRLREGARQVAEQRLAAPVVCAQVEALYATLLHEVRRP